VVVVGRIHADLRQRFDREGAAQACEDRRTGPGKRRGEPFGAIFVQSGGKGGLDRCLRQNDLILTHRHREADTGGSDH
jgi:hypothetical protein